MKFITMLALTLGLDVIFMIGKYWAYDKCSDSDWSDTMKLLYITFDAIKDAGFIFLVLNYLLQ